DIVLGDTAITEPMKQLCSRPLPGNRKRLAKSSTQVRLQREAERGITHPQDEHDTPVLHMQSVTSQMTAVVDQQIIDDRTVPVSMPPHDFVSPVLLSFAPLLRPPTATAELRRREAKVRARWLWFTLSSVL